MKYPRINDLHYDSYKWRVTLEYSSGNSLLIYGFTKHAALRAAILECRRFIAVEVAKNFFRSKHSVLDCCTIHSLKENACLQLHPPLHAPQ